MTEQTATGHNNESRNKKTKKTTTQHTLFTIKFGLVMALLISFVLPVILFSPLLIAKVLGLNLIERVGMTADNFGVFIFFSQAIGLFVSFAIIAKQLKRRHMSWSNVGMRGFKTFQAVRYITGYYLILLSLLIALAVIATSLGTQIPSSPNNESGGTGMLRIMGSFWLTFALTVVIAPIVEEVVFRGVLFPAIKRRFGLGIGIAASSLIFTLVHVNPIQMISVLPLGIYLAIMYQRTGSIYPGIILHATWNLFVLLIAQSSI